LNDGLSVEEQLFVESYLRDAKGAWRKADGSYFYSQNMPLCEYRETCNAFDRKTGSEPGNSLWRIYFDEKGGAALKVGYEDGRALLSARSLPLIESWLSCAPPQNLSGIDRTIEAVLYHCSPVFLEELEARVPREILYRSLRKLAGVGRVYAVRLRGRAVLTHPGIISPRIVGKKDAYILASLAEVGGKLLDAESSAILLKDLEREGKNLEWEGGEDVSV